MDRAERAVLRARLAHWRPRHHTEIEVGKLRELLDDCDRLERVDDAFALRGSLIALEHYRYGREVDGCRCNSCESVRVHARMHKAEGAP
jgi:hypothetical protein